MNPTNQECSCDDDHRFDLLVDGELSESQRRELLAGLDNEPGGWRRCALAFLEAQCWKDGLDFMLGDSDRAASTKAAVSTKVPVSTRAAASTEAASRRSQARPGRLGTLLAMAACFLVALLLGSQLQPLWRGPTADPGPGVKIAGEVGGAVEPAPHEPAPQLAPETPEPSTQRPDTQRPDRPASPWQMVTLGPVDGLEGSGEPIRLPAMERETVDSQWLQGLPTAMPEEVLQALEQSGHRIQQHREWLPLRMKDGRRLVVPVEEVDVQYVGRPAL